MNALCAIAIGAVIGWLGADPEQTAVRSGFETVHEKFQSIRALDVVGLGPLMITAGTVGLVSRTARFILIAAGAATMTFNGRNFVRNLKTKK